MGTTLVLPFTPLGAMFGLMPLPWSLMLSLLGITALYLLASEGMKRMLFARSRRQRTPDSRSRPVKDGSGWRCN